MLGVVQAAAFYCLIHTLGASQPPLRKASNALDDLEEDQQRSEFIRTSWSDEDYVRKFVQQRTYSAPSRTFECYSCMSLVYKSHWNHLSAIYHQPKVFTDRCRDPESESRMPTLACSSVCISMLEPNIEAGIFIGYKHIRGCLDRVLRHGFNQSAIRTHRFHQHNQCRTLARSQLFNPGKQRSHHHAIGDVQLCACFGDKCNKASSSREKGLIPLLLSLFLLLRLCSPHPFPFMSIFFFSLSFSAFTFLC